MSTARPAATDYPRAGGLVFSSLVFSSLVFGSLVFSSLAFSNIVLGSQGSPPTTQTTSAAFTDDTQSALTAMAGDAERGEWAFNSRDKGHCLLCHQLASNTEPFQGTIGPPLDGVGARLTTAQLRFRIVDSSRLNSDTRMPAYYKTEGLNQVAQAFIGQPVLTAQEVEDLVAYLSNQRPVTAERY